MPTSRCGFGLPFDSRLTLGGVPGASCALIDRGRRATYATGEEPAKGNARNDPPAWIGGQDGDLNATSRRPAAVIGLRDDAWVAGSYWSDGVMLPSCATAQEEPEWIVLEVPEPNASRLMFSTMRLVPTVAPRNRSVRRR